jgi:hypothetical protein
MIVFVGIAVVTIIIGKLNPSLDTTDEGELLLWYTPLRGESRKYIKIY